MPGGSRNNGYPAKDMQARHIENLLEKPMRVACALCPGWSFEGRAENALHWQAKHRKKHGTQKKLSRRTVRNLKSFRQAELSDEDVVEIDAEVAKRRRLHGLNGQEVAA